MRSTVFLMAAYCTAFPCIAEIVSFDRATLGTAPAGWTAAMTHDGGAPRWEILGDDSAPSRPNVLAQVSQDATNARFPLAVYDRANVMNGEVSVRFKTISGTVDQAAGLVWRYRDPDNYYVVRANALENNIVLYKVEKGERVALAPKGSPPQTYGVEHPVPKQKWSTLSVTFQGEAFTVRFDGQEVFSVEDRTFPGAGRVGLWTKADSVTYFDEFQIEGK